MTVICLNYATSSQLVEDNFLKLEIDLNQHFVVDDPDYRLVNPIIHLSLPHSVFPSERDIVSFEYQLMLVNIKDQKTHERNSIIIIKLIDLLIEKTLTS